MCFDMAHEGIGWPEAVKSDLKWLCGMSTFSSRSGDSFEDWSSYIRANSKPFRVKVKKYATTRFANCYCPPPAAHSSPEQPATFVCSFDGCPFMAPSKQQLSMHLFRIHKVKSVWKNYLGSHLFCPICLKYFHTRERVLNHVRYRSEICRHNLVIRFADKMWTDAEVSELDSLEAESHVHTQATGKRRHHAEAPVIQMAGPLLPIMLLGNDSTHHPLGRGHHHICS